MIMALLFGLLISFLLLSLPVGVAVGGASLVTAIVTGTMSIGYVTRTMISAYDSFPLLAVPLFLFAGEIMSRGGISERLFDLARLFLGRFTGGVPMAVVGACLMFGALSGAGAADTAAVGSIMIPAMIKMGYGKGFSSAIVAASGGLAIIMPPSLPLVLYGVSSSTSIGDLFLAGVIPACLIAFLMMCYCYIYCRVKGLTNEKVILTSTKKPWEVLVRSALAIIMPLIILGGIYGGIFTPTEAAGVAVIYSLFISIFVYRTINFRSFIDIVRTSAGSIGPILIILGGAIVFGRILITNEIPATIAKAMLSFSDNPLVFLLLVNILLIIVGIFMETLSSVIILTPILMPIAVTMGINPVHFGIIMVVNLAIGLITPPMAVNLFIVSSISGLSIEELSKNILVPFLVLLAGLFIISYVPSVALVLLGK